MKTRSRFTFPTVSRLAAREMPMDFDLHVNIGDWIEFESVPGNTWEVTRKKFKVLSDNTIEYVDYVTVPVSNPELP